MNFCSQCGNKLSLDGLFCSQCGQKVNQQPINQQPPTQVQPQSPVHQVQPVPQNQAKWVFTLSTVETKGVSFNYVYLIFHTNRVVIATVSGKMMEKEIHETLKILKKQSKMKLKEQMAYRQTHLDQFLSHLQQCSDAQIVAMNPSNLIIPLSLIHQGVFQFYSTTTYYDEEDSTTSTKKGYIELVVGERILKYPHNYPFHKDTKALLESVLPGKIKFRN